MADLFDTEENTPAQDVAEPAEAETAPAPEESAPTPQKDAPKKKKRTFFDELFDCFETFCHALVLMTILFVFVFRFVTVNGTSMVNTLHHEDKLIISDMFYTPSTGDIVVVNTDGMGAFSDKYIIKRVIATGNQQVEIDFVNWTVTVDGVKLNEEYVYRSGAVVMESASWINHDKNVARTIENGILTKASFVVPKGQFFAMGDNRNGSSDSRHAGCFDKERILGRVLIRISPSDAFGRVE